MSGPSRPVAKCGEKSARVRVQVDHQLAARDRQRAPHGVALAEHRPEIGEQLGLLVDLGAARRGHLGASRRATRHRRRAPGRSAAQGSAAAPRSRPTVSATSRAGSTTVTVSRFSSSSRSSAVLRVMEGPDQLTRTIAVRESCPDHLPLGSRARAGPRRGARGHVSRARAGRASPEPIPDDLHPALLEGLAAAGIESLWAHQADTLEAARRGPRDRDHGHRERQVARLQPAGARHARERRGGARLLPLPDEGARAGPGARARAPRRQVPRHAIYDGDTPREERRADPAALEPDPHEPGHAARGRPAEPPLLGRRAREPRLGRRGRGARVPRRVRLPRGERAAPAAPARPRLRQRPALPAHERDDREPERAGRAPHGRGGAARGPRRRPARRAPDRDVEPAARGRAARAGAPRRCPRRRTCSPSWSSARSGRSAS